MSCMYERRKQVKGCLLLLQVWIDKFKITNYILNVCC
jgi:hypothetical protein